MVIMTSKEKRTSSNRSAFVSAFTKSLMLPPAIHSDTSTNRFSEIVTPTSGRTFGCRRVLHATTSLQDLYETWSVVGAHNRSWGPLATHPSNPLEVTP